MRTSTYSTANICSDTDAARRMREGVSNAELADIVLAHPGLVTLAAISVVIESMPPRASIAVAKAVSPAARNAVVVGRYLVGVSSGVCCTEVTCGSSSMRMLSSFFQ